MRNCPKASPKESIPMKCELCARYGHRTDFCWEDEKNAHRRPEGWRSILPPKSDPDDDAVLISYSLMTYLCDEFDADDEQSTYSDTDSIELTSLSSLPDPDLLSWQRAIEMELQQLRDANMASDPQSNN